MSRNVLIALGAGVVLLGGAGVYLYMRRSAGNPTYSNVGGAVPAYVPSGYDPLNPQGPPLPAANKTANLFQQVGSAVQQGAAVAKAGQAAFGEAKKTWTDIQGYFS